MRRQRRAYNYKFTERTHSVKGIAGLVLAIISIVSGVGLTSVSYANAGAGTVYLGSGGVLAMLVALAAFILAVMSMKEEDRYRIFPVMSLVFGIVALVGWVVIYVSGF